VGVVVLVHCVTSRLLSHDWVFSLLRIRCDQRLKKFRGSLEGRQVDIVLFSFELYLTNARKAEVQ
jgi:hypothetical protein